MQLLKKTVGYYFAFSALLLLGAIPFFYFTLKSIVVNNADESLQAVKTRIMPQLLQAASAHAEGKLDVSDYYIAFHKETIGRRRDSIYNFSIHGILPGELLPGRAMASHFIFNQELYSVEIKTSMVDKISLIKKIVLLVGILMLLLLLGLLLLNRWLSRLIWLPFYNTLKNLHAYQIDKMDVLKLNRSSIKEFNDLNTAIEQLSQRDWQAYVTQKEFTENASHEMQSPLAVFQSKLELLMQTDPLNEEQTSLITDLANASKRMLRLNKSLLLLTRIDNNQFVDKEPVSLREIAERLLQQYDFQIKRQSIEIFFQGSGDISMEANRTLLEILLSNLLSNAIRHNIQNGLIRIVFKETELIIQNSGKFSALNPLTLFKRFKKESSDINSLGLGLEIVKKICLLNHYTIQYSFLHQLHTFTLQFV